MTSQQSESEWYLVSKDELRKLMSWSTHKSPSVCQYERRLEILKQVQNRPAPSPESVCPFWESPIGDHGKGTCQFDDGDCRYPDDPDEWKDCMRKERHNATITARVWEEAREKRIKDYDHLKTHIIETCNYHGGNWTVDQIINHINHRLKFLRSTGGDRR